MSAAEGLASHEVTRALVVAAGSLFVKECLKDSTAFGLIAEAMVACDNKVTLPLCIADATCIDIMRHSVWGTSAVTVCYSVF